MAEPIHAQLIVHNIAGMTKIQLKTFRKWITAVAKELTTEDPKIFSKRYRVTLFK